MEVLLGDLGLKGSLLLEKRILLTLQLLNLLVQYANQVCLRSELLIVLLQILDFDLEVSNFDLKFQELLLLVFQFLEVLESLSSHLLGFSLGLLDSLILDQLLLFASIILPIAAATNSIKVSSLLLFKALLQKDIGFSELVFTFLQ